MRAPAGRPQRREPSIKGIGDRQRKVSTGSERRQSASRRREARQGGAAPPRVSVEGATPNGHRPSRPVPPHGERAARQFVPGAETDTAAWRRASARGPLDGLPERSRTARPSFPLSFPLSFPQNGLSERFSRVRLGNSFMIPIRNALRRQISRHFADCLLRFIPSCVMMCTT